MSTTLVTRHKEWKRSNPLREWRTENGVSIHEAASLMNVSMTSIQLWESNGATPSPKNMERLMKLVGPNVSKRWDRWVESNPANNI